eukprot:COSAG05_NODE_1751_length_4143_cov_2.852621_6_plen_291_part_00
MVDAGPPACCRDYIKNVKPLEEILATFEEFLPSSHHCTTQTFIHLARSYQHAQKWNACDKLCTRATDKLDTATAGGAVKQALITILCCQGLACFRTGAGPIDRVEVSDSLRCIACLHFLLGRAVRLENHLSNVVVTGVEKRKTHAENCYRRALNIVREMSHPSWRPVELKTSHEFASELISAELYDTAIAEVNKALGLLQSLEHPPRCAIHRATHPSCTAATARPVICLLRTWIIAICAFFHGLRTHNNRCLYWYTMTTTAHRRKGASPSIPAMRKRSHPSRRLMLPKRV